MSDITVGQLQLHDALHLVGIVILYYDHLITFLDEYRYIWANKWSAASWLFFLNRYFAFFANIAVNVGNFVHFTSKERSVNSSNPAGTHLLELICSQYSLYRQIVLIISQVIVCANLLLRTYALYNRDKRVAGLILSIASVLAALACWSVVGQKSDIWIANGCHLALSRITAIRIAVAWEALFVYDIMIVTLTLARTYKVRFRRRRQNSRDLVGLIIRDGTIYFTVMGFANFANTLTFYILTPVLRGVLSTLASAISVTMMSRLMLNLHREAGIAPESTLSSEDPSSPNTTTMLFSSRLIHPSALGDASTDSETMTRSRATAIEISDPYGSSYSALDDTPLRETEEIELSPLSRQNRQNGTETV